jgi:hypothetical protein
MSKRASRKAMVMPRAMQEALRALLSALRRVVPDRKLVEPAVSRLRSCAFSWHKKNFVSLSFA